ncbi:enoyl-CoA hydratase/isomerase family protein [Spirillospora sp. CA-294931]|uniref:enoyl-CoA hydratase/isomerase family protein n=1 Tax=Spirillospora sp. CA-294931 TaxID=3240042 RepID=UPI003D8D325D
MTERLITSLDGRVLTVRFDNPPRHFFDARMGAELDALVTGLRRDRTVRAVVFTGQGENFITHVDVPMLAHGAGVAPFRVPYPLARAITRVPARQLRTAARISTALARLTRSDKVTIAAINGLALGMGCVFALACDIRLMNQDKRIGLPESGLGVLAAAGATQRLVRSVGAGRALELLLDGRALTASEAVGIGLVHRAVPAAGLQDEASTLAHRLAGRPAATVREIKRMVHDAATRPAARGLAMEAASLVTTLSSGQAEPRLTAYRDWLAGHPDPTDQEILDGLGSFLTGGPLR